jgi:hypothetical protein
MWGVLIHIEVKVDKDAEIENGISQDKFPQAKLSGQMGRAREFKACAP